MPAVAPLPAPPTPVSTPAEGIKSLEDLVALSTGLLEKAPSQAEMQVYRELLQRILEDVFGQDSRWLSEVQRVMTFSPYYEGPVEELIKDRHNEIREKNVIIAGCIKDLQRMAARTPAVTPGPTSGLEAVENLLRQFHRFAVQLRKRHAGRKALMIKDEYDVQDLLHALLLTQFADVRPEEHAPSRAAASPRLDFLLKNEQIVIEVKKTRPSLTHKALADELIADIARYQAHPDCKTLVCFIYDPEARLANVAGFVSDIQSTLSKITLRVLVVPQH